MHLTTPGLADLLTDIFVVLAQILIARLYFTQWEKRLPPPLSRVTRGLLFALWFAIGFSLLMRGAFFPYRLRFLPASFRSFVSAAGNLYGMTAVFSLAIFYLFRWLANRASPEHSPSRRRLIQAAGAVAVGAPFATVGFGSFIERTRFEIKEVDLPIPGLHPDLEGLRIGQLTDLHVSPWLSVRDAGRAVDMLNELKPHLSLVTGDLITQVGDPLDATIRELSRLRADAGILGCLGNHERYSRCENYETAQAARYGLGMLRDEARLLRFGSGVLNVAGVDFQRSTHREDYLRDAERLIVPGATNLMLSHNPDVFPVAVEKGYDAVISGHTHGGQVTVEIFNQTLNMARFVTPYVAGLYRMDGRSCYVSAGLGTIAIPVRIGAPPEITLLRLRKS
jgi:uncharacterized protein